MKASRNRLTPFLVITLIVLLWILIFILVYKVMKNVNAEKVKKLKLDDDLVQELYSYVTEDDIKFYTEGNFTVSTLPNNYIFSKATKFLLLEDVVFKGNSLSITYDSLDGAIKTAFGPDFKYDLKNINGVVNTYIQLNEKNISVNIMYDANTNSYIGTIVNTEEPIVKVKYDLVGATKDENVNLKIGYVYYKIDGNYKICKDKTCTEIAKELDSIDNYEYETFVTVSLEKASDEIYYYNSNS